MVVLNVLRSMCYTNGMPSTERHSCLINYFKINLCTILTEC